jgi:hypothetical protein
MFDGQLEFVLTGAVAFVPFTYAVMVPAPSYVAQSTVSPCAPAYGKFAVGQFREVHTFGSAHMPGLQPAVEPDPLEMVPIGTLYKL